jgi:RNA polymerase sigma-70 factor, ECF subfamily
MSVAGVDQLRRRAARPAGPADDEAALDALGQRGDRPAADPTSDTDAAPDVAATLQLLPAGQRAALVLVDMLGYSVAVADDVLGVSPGTVKGHCARDRARLLPHVAHPRESGQVRGRRGTQTAAGRVSPPPGMRPAPTAAPAEQAAEEGRERR